MRPTSMRLVLIVCMRSGSGPWAYRTDHAMHSTRLRAEATMAYRTDRGIAHTDVPMMRLSRVCCAACGVRRAVACGVRSRGGGSEARRRVAADAICGTRGAMTERRATQGYGMRSRGGARQSDWLTAAVCGMRLRGGVVATRAMSGSRAKATTAACDMRHEGRDEAACDTRV